ncbi:MAG: LuxR C-terminal-related transcriptional regulator [Blastococcus sp.]
MEALEGRTEGWIAALQLAALSMQGRDDVAGFIAGFAGNDRYIVDYLAEEVLQRQPDRVRNFLLQTSILSRLSGTLCDAVTGQDDGKVMLEALDRANLFLVPLDDRRRWYRYHHLFADVLQAHLLDEQPDRVRELHLRASGWHEQNGDRAEAIDHALAGADVERAANLVERAIPELRRNRQEATLRSWLEALPDELFRVRPVLTMGLVGSLMAQGDFEGVEVRLLQAERWLDPTTAGAGEMVVVDEEAFRTLPTAISMYRAGTALVRGDVAGTMTHARRALDLAGEDDHLARGAPAALLGLAYWTSGDLDESSRLYVDAMASLERAGYHSDVLGGSIALADMRLAQGRLREAMSIFERGLQRAEQSQPILRGAADMHVGLSQVLRERNDLDAARKHLQASSDLGEHVGLPQNRYRWRVAMARIREAEGDLSGALDLLDEAEHLYVGDFSPDVRPVPAVRARVLVARGEWRAALDWARDRGLSADDELSYLREFEHVTLARALLARYTAERDERSIREAAALLERLRSAAEYGGRTGSLLDVLVVQALASQALGDMAAALTSLRRALTLAEPEGYVRIFVDEGPPMASLLNTVAKDGEAGSYVRRLLAAFDGTVVSRPVPPGLIDPLSVRELDVLRLLGSDLDGPDIARRLFVSLNTVRTHTKNIYAKLGVNNRRAAVRRAAELQLVARPR